jgi:hypothetical protein
MKIIIIQNTVALGGSVFIGDEIEVGNREGRELIAMRKAAPAPPDQPKAYEVAVAAPVETAVMPKPRRRRKSK